MAKPDRELKGKSSPTEPACPLADSSEKVPAPSEADIDESLDESFPASDPPSWVPLARLGSPKRKPRG